MSLDRIGNNEHQGYNKSLGFHLYLIKVLARHSIILASGLVERLEAIFLVIFSQIEREDL